MGIEPVAPLPAHAQTLIQTSEAARLCQVSTAMILLWERSGQLPALKTARGIRLFDRDTVARFAQARQASERRGGA